MRIPYNRPWLLEVADQPWCPPYLREPVQGMLTFLWTHRVPPFQLRAPYEGAVDVLERAVEDVEEDLRAEGEVGAGAGAGAEGKRRESGGLRVVDFGSGAGGPLALVEKRINQRRLEKSQPPIPIYLSDLHPHTTSALALPTASTPEPLSSHLSYIPESVDATNAPPSVTSERHIRTFFLSFHHFNEDAARRVLADAMKTAEGICIFELQELDLGSVLMILMLGPLTWLLIPFQRPNLKTLLFTYLIPLIPLLLVLDGLISIYRTRTTPHILHLANLASLSLALEGEDKDDGGIDWVWEHGRKRHTWPFGRMTWIVGRRDRRCGGAETEAETEVEGALSEVETVGELGQDE
ncbi:hypothetical protein IAT38_005767 [Cryptococcus sp. DSM 104549]